MIKHLGALRPFFIQHSHYSIAFFRGNRADLGVGFAIALGALCVIILAGLINDNRRGK